MTRTAIIQHLWVLTTLHRVQPKSINNKTTTLICHVVVVRMRCMPLHTPCDAPFSVSTCVARRLGLAVRCHAPITSAGFVQMSVQMTATAAGAGVAAVTGREPLAMASMAVNYKGGAPIDAVHIIECTTVGAAGDKVRVVRAVLRPTRAYRAPGIVGDIDDRRASQNTPPFAMAEARFTTATWPASAL